MNCVKQSRKNLGAFLLFLVVSCPLLADNGRFEINQTVVDASGGFPFIITTSGSYVLTGNLAVPAVTTGISVQAEQVSIDLNGFAITGPFVCNLGDCTSTGSFSGITTLGSPRYVSVFNGQVNGFPQRCISVSFRGRVENTRVFDCGKWGIVASTGSIVMGNRVTSVGEIGINLSGEDTTVYGHNTVANTNQVESDHLAIFGGKPTAGNNCDDGSCSSRNARRFYLTKTEVSGGDALDACEAGYHMASMWELYDPSGLEYDKLRGQSAGDQGSGPPSAPGWARTANPFNTVFDSPGDANCLIWGSSSILEKGTVINIHRDVTASQAHFGPWNADIEDCDTPKRVWCIQD